MSGFTSKTGRDFTDEELEDLIEQAERGFAHEIPRLPTMQTTTDVLPLFLLAMTDLAKTFTRLLEKELENF